MYLDPAILLGSASIQAEFFQWMRENGVYDNTRILVASDHSGYLQDYLRLITDESLQDIWKSYRPNALLMITPFASQGEFSISDSHMMLSDIYRIIADELDPTEAAVRPAGTAARERLVHSGRGGETIIR